jgi:hypothetical protein
MDLMTPNDVAREAKIRIETQKAWRHKNRYGFNDLVLKVGHLVRYRREDFERWLVTRQVVQPSQPSAE